MTFKKSGLDKLAEPAEVLMPEYIWSGGSIMPWDDATVHVTAMSWTAISAVFEGIRAYWNEEMNQLYIFRLEAHLKRLWDSMKLMRMSSPYSSQELENAIIQLLRANQSACDTYISPFAYFSGSVPGYRAAYQLPVEIYITGHSNPSNLELNRGSRCCVSSWARISDNVMPPRAKGIANYQNSRLVSTEAHINGYDAGIILNAQGKVAEGAYACIFLIRNGVAITPPVTAGILEGITRETVIELFQEDLGMTVEEREVDRTELYVADEVFLCGTYAEIEPVVSVDKYRVGSGRIGRTTKHVRQLYKDIVRGRVESRLEWLTPVWKSL